MANIATTLKELNDIIDFLKTKVDGSAGFTGTEKTDWEKRIDDLRNNSESQDLSIKGVENIGNQFVSEKTKLEAEKKKAEEDKATAETNLTTLQTQVANKLTPALLTELEKYPELKTALEEIKNKGVNYVVDLSTVNTKLEELKKGGSQEMNYLITGTIILGAISVLLLGYIAFFKSNKASREEE